MEALVGRNLAQGGGAPAFSVWNREVPQRLHSFGSSGARKAGKNGEDAFIWLSVGVDDYLCKAKYCLNMYLALVFVRNDNSHL